EPAGTRLAAARRGALARHLPGDGFGADGHRVAVVGQPAGRYRAGDGRSAGRFLRAECGLSMPAAHGTMSNKDAAAPVPAVRASRARALLDGFGREWRRGSWVVRLSVGCL